MGTTADGLRSAVAEPSPPEARPQRVRLIFAALLLAESGYRPLVLERGRPVERRTADVAALLEGGAFDP